MLHVLVLTPQVPVSAEMAEVVAQQVFSKR